ncbi:MAG: tRNA (adenosine(37)-N6)-threonylcarbamoyltransferase complex dimerization subunit type 1 TsaB [Acidobacteriota bacterium]
MLLAIDTATKMLGLALYDGSVLLNESVWYSNNHHTTELAPEVAISLRRAGASHLELTAVAVAQGPGSYTGLRIGMALAKGLSLAHNLPIVGIPTLDILASAQPQREEPMLATLQAGRGRVAAVWYKWTRNGWTARKGMERLTWDELVGELKQTTYICGELDAKAREALKREALAILAPASMCVRRPGVMAELAWQKVRKGKIEDPSTLAPIYLDPIS